MAIGSCSYLFVSFSPEYNKYLSFDKKHITRMYQQQCKPLQTVVLFYVINFFLFGSKIIPLRALL